MRWKRSSSSDVDIDLAALAREGLAAAEIPDDDSSRSRIEQQHIIDELRSLVASMEAGE
jgi:hypothetical protein